VIGSAATNKKPASNAGLMDKPVNVKPSVI
jgi:hypothetical protein